MKIGTKSVLYGAHCLFIHPVFVFAAWWKLYGFPWDPRLWIAFFVHDLGYWGKPNMDGKEGETHVEWGAKVMHKLFDYKSISIAVSTYEGAVWADGRKMDRSTNRCYTIIKGNRFYWYDMCLYHSRFYAKKDKANYSLLCVADKLAITLEPHWLYLPRVNWTGEIEEYMAAAKNDDGKYNSMALSSDEQQEWFSDVCAYLKKWAYEHKDGKRDTWTPSV